MDAALGSRANVFYVQRPSGKKTDRQNTSHVIIHPQATSTVARQSLETMISLSKVFPVFYVPSKQKDEAKASTSSTSCKIKADPDFWDILLKLDNCTKKGKNVTRTYVNTERADPASLCINVESYNFQHLLQMLTYPLIKRSSFLTDKMLRLLNVAAQGLAENTDIKPTIVQENCNERPSSALVAKNQTVLEIPEKHLKLAIDVLTSKSCTEDGLDDATAFLLNLSSGPVETRNMVSNHSTTSIQSSLFRLVRVYIIS